MSRIKESSINELREHIDSKMLVEHYVKLENRGGKWWGCCPFHGEATPSFNLDSERGVFYCFGCGKGGSIITFIMEIEKLNFVEAVEFIAKKIGFTLQYEEGEIKEKKDDTKDEMLKLYSKVASLFHTILLFHKEGKEALEYLKARGIEENIIEKFQLGYAPKNRKWLYSFLQKKSYTKNFLSKTGLFSEKYPNIAFFSDRIMFPICDRYGTPIAFGGRTLSKDVAKYINTKDMVQYKKGSNLFAFSFAMQEMRKEKSVVLCEGYMDVIAYHQGGVKNAVAPLGTALTEEQIDYLKNFVDNFYLSFDSDEAGRKATYKAILMIRKVNRNVYVVNIKDEKDPADILKNEGASTLPLLIKNAILDVDYLLLVVSKKFNIKTSDGKVKALFFLFSYIRVISSSVYKEEVIRQISQTLNIKEASILSDYNKYLKGDALKVKQQKEELSKFRGTKYIKTAEMRLLLLIVFDRKLFVDFRSNVKVHDLEDRFAKEIYIILEECFREGKESFEQLLAKCENPVLKEILKEGVASNDVYNENREQILKDGIRFVNLNRLKKRREQVVNKIHSFSYKENETKEMQDLLIEKNELDNKILFFMNNTEKDDELFQDEDDLVSFIEE